MDVRIHLGRRAVLVVVLVLALLAAAGVAYATIPDAGGVYTACKLNATGTIRLIDPAGPSTSLLSHCTALESQITWNQKGQQGVPGKDGSSPTVAQLQAGDSHCPAGGASITGASGDVAYVCNGANGADGKPGKDGAPFAGTFTSPNGQFTLTVADSGVSIVGPDSSVSLPSGGGIVIHGGTIQTVASTVDTQIAQDQTTSVGRDRTETVGRDESTTVAGNRSESVSGNESVAIGSGRSETVQQDEEITVGGNRTESVGQGETVTVSGKRTERVGGSLDIAAGGSAQIVAAILGLNGGSAGCRPAARKDDPVNSSVILAGSTTVCIGG